ncbi:MAG: hypothetical protein PHH21_00605 [Candidatus Pacebacteria bacterium]|nr:hypothetical protein [Candidatus Paceibacterota bacterium]
MKMITNPFNLDKINQKVTKNILDIDHGRDMPEGENYHILRYNLACVSEIGTIEISLISNNFRIGNEREMLKIAADDFFIAGMEREKKLREKSKPQSEECCKFHMYDYGGYAGSNKALFTGYFTKAQLHEFFGATELYDFCWGIKTEKISAITTERGIKIINTSLENMEYIKEFFAITGLSPKGWTIKT